MVLPMNGVRPSPPPTITSKPVSPAPFRCIRRPISWTRTAARSCAEAVIAILNLRGRNENSGWSVRCWRSSSAQSRGSSISPGATPAHWSVVILRTQLPLVCMPCMPASRQIGHRVGQFFELDPVELDVLARGEMAVVAVIAPRHMRQRAQLRGGQRAIRNGDPQHIGVQLQINAVHEPQRLEFVFGQFAGEAARDLIAEFADTLVHKRAVEVVVNDTCSILSAGPEMRRSGRCNGSTRANCLVARPVPTIPAPARHRRRPP